MSGGKGGNHRVVLIRKLDDGRWFCAVIESAPKDPVFVFDTHHAAKLAGVGIGSAIRLPVARVDVKRLGDKAGVVSGRTCILIEKALADATKTD